VANRQQRGAAATTVTVGAYGLKSACAPESSAGI
jgi:hypothetical protein